MRKQFIQIMSLTAPSLLVSVSIVAIFLQFYLHELPCPLCLLQRVGCLLMAIGFLMNLRIGFQSRHYGLILLSALFTFIVATRQVLLHIVPGDAGYGDALLGFHLYTWVVVISLLVMTLVAILLCLHVNFEADYEGMASQWPYAIKSLASLIAVTALTNAILAFVMCGLLPCPDDPVKYLITLF